MPWHPSILEVRTPGRDGSNGLPLHPEGPQPLMLNSTEKSWLWRVEVPSWILSKHDVQSLRKHIWWLRYIAWLRVGMVIAYWVMLCWETWFVLFMFVFLLRVRMLHRKWWPHDILPIPFGLWLACQLVRCAWLRTASMKWRNDIVLQTWNVGIFQGHGQTLPLLMVWICNVYRWMALECRMRMNEVYVSIERDIERIQLKEIRYPLRCMNPASSTKWKILPTGAEFLPSTVWWYCYEIVDNEGSWFSHV